MICVKLYELSEQYRKLSELAEEAFDNGQIENEDDLELWISILDGINDSIEKKTDNIIRFIKNLEAEVLAYKSEEGRLSKQRKYRENKIESLKNYLSSMLQHAKIKELQAGTFKVSFRKSPASVEIIDVEKIPLQFKKPQPDKIMKDELKKALKNNQAIEGAKLVNDKVSLSIR
ncbi:hypothetical protein B7C51_24655 (plasmid) [Paenibacillus larvae subsp. pulvifaciens]|uniref:Siphovirus Gp157 n=1 Tax=Paenibacillus larvae subsp. pulvifaciens TaxID=1477 RepID=A0A1V0V039_9BACL|nr:hypothetical protein B7C51_24655 [Paenibacillus larvae subsp. pulvifaciens]